MKILITLMSMAWAIPGLCVSRVGGGKIQSVPSGFEITIPNPFSNIKESSNGLRAVGPIALVPAQGLQRQFIEISEFAADFPDTVSLGRESLMKRLLQSKWIEFRSSHECVLALKSHENGVFALLLTWGDGKGFTLKGPLSTEVEEAATKVVSSLVLDSEVCSWK